MSVLPYSYGPSLVGVAVPLVPVGPGVLTNEGASGGQYESTPGWRVILRNRGDQPVGLVGVAGSAAPETVPFPGAATANWLDYSYYRLEPGDETEYGIAPQAAEGVTPDGGLGVIFTAIVPLGTGPALMEVTTIQTDPAPTLSY